MAGFLTGVFDGGDDSRSAEAQHLGASDQFDADPSITVGHSESVAYEDMNGTEHSYSNSQELTLDVSTHAMLGVAADASQGAFNGNGFEE